MPTFVKEILGERVHEEEAVTFEAVYSGNPMPGTCKCIVYVLCMYGLKANNKNTTCYHTDWYRGDTVSQTRSKG